MCLQVAEETAAKWEGRKPKFARQIRKQVESCLTVHELTSNAKRRLYSINMMERVMREIKRQTNVVGIFSNTAAADRLIGEQLLDRQGAWQCEGKRYIVMDGTGM